MVSINGDTQEPSAQEEKIFVAVRLRPLNEKEIVKNDTSDWECINNTTIIYKNGITERSLYPTAYTFDGVYGCDSTTKQVYEEGAKRVALSVVEGINSSIFAYGQTSSGKTYTMSGVTQFAISDILDYVNKQHDREFVLKFSAIEIYNECVRDLLSADNTPLRLLDDPEKGTVIDRLTEVNLIDWSHLMELLAVCEAQRQIGETSLNEMSSRSHQIIRLTVESSAREFFGADSASTLTATVNFVDLAGSERASQTLSAGARLKEGCHINRSLLTLGTVVRKLSKGRSGHIPYRDSKLTRILQNALGGNARTAIICTLSPAHGHVEQSRNTLLFAVCAKQVRTNAQVNVVMSEKAMVKQLQRELARLENELKTISSTDDSAAIIKEKELQIEKMEKEIKELTQERDLARSRLEEILRAAGVDQSSLPWMDSSPRHQHKSSWDSETSESSGDPLHVDAPINTYSFPQKQDQQISDDDQYFFDNISPSQFMNQYFGPDLGQGWDKIAQRTRKVSQDSCKEVQCIKKDQKMDDSDGDKQNEDYIETDHVEPSSPCSSDVDLPYSRSSSLTRSRSGRAVAEGGLSPTSEKNVVVESMANSEYEENFPRKTIPESRSDGDIKNLSRQDSQISVISDDEKEMEHTEEDMYALSPSARTLQKVMNFKLKPEYDEYMDNQEKPQVIESEETAKENFDYDKEDWPAFFEKQRRKIIELWDECNIPLLHRTYFFLLIKGDPSDSVYIEVELRRLSFLKETISRAESEKALNRERAMLSRKLLRKFTSKERDAIFENWGIDLDSRYRRAQLSQLLWSKTNDIEHARDSAEIVAKLVGLIEPNKTPKELFALSFAPKHQSKTSSWRHSMSLHRLVTQS